ncbi:NAD(P)H-dependent oxidoreductase [Anaerofustis stercorihominis]|uniref:Flavin reductase n=1 Tax=Anaerofustis stercorihominis DSM 17244 TaxID=445971 RepID=B1C7P2_9FIRM|nr:NADPH-dependent FMN reductase [Anaerofustis stercorihominis]EDS73029.1 flavin reductase [Anaerofustis stercorihominis DSM 17244]MCQ4794345.1 NAD(P)H-dependent oxidoreductase [Anaerofustis stercorihominis]
MSQYKIIGIVGSFKKSSLNLKLAQTIKEYLKDKAEFEILDYTKVPFFNEDIENPTPEAVTNVRNKIKEADAIWFFTPEYNHYFPGILKNLLDWLSRPISKDIPQVLKDKPICVSGITPGMTGTVVAQDHLISVLNFLNAKVMMTSRLTFPNALKSMDDIGNIIKGLEFIHAQADDFIKFIELNK